jgi:DNA modification methylase
MPDVGKEWLNRMHFGNCITSLNAMPEKFINTCVTSPPYFGLRDYGSGKWEGGDPDHKHEDRGEQRRTSGRNDVDRMYGPNGKAAPGRRDTPTISDHRDIAQLKARAVPRHGATCSCGATFIDEQIGQEQTPEEFIDNLVEVFRAVRRVLRDDGTIWVNLGDTYAGNGGYSPDAPSNVKRMEALARGERKDGSFGVSKRNHESHTPPKRRVYDGIKAKDLIGIPWMFAFAMRADGWYLRMDNIWNKPNPMPESISDRPTKAHEYIFLMSKSDRYFYDADAIAEPAMNAGHLTKMGGGKKPNRAYANNRKPSGNERPDAPPVLIGETKNKRSVWTVNAKPYSGAHFATYPEELIEPCILAGSPARGVVLDPFMGSGTTAAVAARLERYWVGCELNASNRYLQLERLGRTWLYDEDTPSSRARVRLDEGVRIRLD